MPLIYMLCEFQFSPGMTRVEDRFCDDGTYNPPWNFCADNKRLDESTEVGDSGEILKKTLLSTLK